LKLFKILGRVGTVEILFTLYRKGACRYSELESLVGNPRSTSKRLKDLVALKLVDRKILADKYRSVDYSLTPVGKEIVSHLVAIKELEEGKRK